MVKQQIREEQILIKNLQKKKMLNKFWENIILTGDQ